MEKGLLSLPLLLLLSDLWRRKALEATLSERDPRDLELRAPQQSTTLADIRQQAATATFVVEILGVFSSLLFLPVFRPFFSSEEERSKSENPVHFHTFRVCVCSRHTDEKYLQILYRLVSKLTNTKERTDDAFFEEHVDFEDNLRHVLHPLSLPIQRLCDILRNRSPLYVREIPPLENGVKVRRIRRYSRSTKPGDLTRPSSQHI